MEQETACRVRLFAEERGMRASGRQAQGEVFEEERQARKPIMIPSESYCPKPVREALGSVFNNVYAEGYPRLQMTKDHPTKRKEMQK